MALKQGPMNRIGIGESGLSSTTWLGTLGTPPGYRSQDRQVSLGREHPVRLPYRPTPSKATKAAQGTPMPYATSFSSALPQIYIELNSSI